METGIGRLQEQEQLGPLTLFYFLMALTATDRNQNLKMNGSGLYGRAGPRREVIQGKAAKIPFKESDYCTDGLPKAFLHSLRTLFDILDDSGRGFVHISEIESRWQGADTRDLPAGVLGCLRRVTPPHGCLSFERFVAGLRYSMLNPENHVKVQATVHPQPAPKQPRKGAPAPGPENKVRPLGPSNLTNTQHHQLHSRPEEVTVYPACAPPPPRYGAERPGRSLERPSAGPEAGCFRLDQNHVPEWVPLRSDGVGKSGLPRSQSESATGLTSGSRRHGRSRDEQRRHTISNGVDYGMLSLRLSSTFVSCLRSAGLCVWRGHGLTPPHPFSPPRRAPPTQATLARCCPDGSESGRAQGPGASGGLFFRTTCPHLDGRVGGLHHSLHPAQQQPLQQQGRALFPLAEADEGAGAGEGLSALSLEVVERAREWYQSQIHNVTERQRQIGQNSKCTDFFNEATQCRMNVLIPKLQEVNRCLSDLITCTGMPVSPGGGQTSPLSSSSQPPPPAPPQAIQRLKDQNRLLTQEVSEKSERITQLEQEKSALIKQLFEARARSSQDTSTMDSTFI
ncbi:hypothetical protein WMY93_020522 [Mugilogobius chulae]|uniref:Suppressor APC domain-containing protein n=1 Tax=Mugilogobius chulae TaxID=88201 RepID=A0AAW0ND03_9GOBI